MSASVLRNGSIGYKGLINASRRHAIASSRVYCSPHSTILARCVHTSQLGTRQALPPDSLPNPQRPKGAEISDEEWEIRTGRAIHLLQQTIPDFFQLGLVTSFDKVTGKPSPSHYIPIGDLHSLTSKEDVESIYDSRVILSYTPPSRLPPPFPQTLQIESFPLYLASSMFLRHTLNALYSDVKVALNKTAVTNPPSSSSDGGPSPSRTRHRDKTFFIGVSVQGINRVTGARAEWEVTSTYSFSPYSGLVNKHLVNSIHPTPHLAMYESLRASIGNVFGIETPAATVRATPKGSSPSR